MNASLTGKGGKGGGNGGISGSGGLISRRAMAARTRYPGNRHPTKRSSRRR